MCRPVYFNIHRFSPGFFEITIPPHPETVCKTIFLFESSGPSYKKIVLQTVWGWGGIVKFNERAPMCRPVYFNIHRFSPGFFEITIPPHPETVCKTIFLFESSGPSYKKIVLQTVWGWGGIVKFNERAPMCRPVYFNIHRFSPGFFEITIPPHPETVCKTIFLFESSGPSYKKIVLQTVWGWGGIVKFNERAPMCRPVYFNIHRFSPGFFEITIPPHPETVCKTIFLFESSGPSYKKIVLQTVWGWGGIVKFNERAPMCRPVYFNIHRFSPGFFEISIPLHPETVCKTIFLFESSGPSYKKIVLQTVWGWGGIVKFNERAPMCRPVYFNIHRFSPGFF